MWQIQPRCTRCGQPLSGGLDTFGPVCEPLCLPCSLSWERDEQLAQHIEERHIIPDRSDWMGQLKGRDDCKQPYGKRWIIRPAAPNGVHRQNTNGLTIRKLCDSIQALRHKARNRTPRETVLVLEQYQDDWYL